MKHKLSTTLALVILTVALAAATARAQTVANGPYYAPPSWDQTIPCTSAANCPRFIVLSNMNSAAVLDRETGLVWERAPEALPRTQFLARSACNRLTLGTRKGWRLPTLQEMLTLFDGDPANTSSPRLPPGHPFINIQVESYWTSTFHENQGGAAVFLGNGNISFNGSAIENLQWCVRGASATTLLP
jgi:hypothetical protein